MTTSNKSNKPNIHNGPAHSTPSLRIILCVGLGNQLFQYAFGRSLALRNNINLEIDAASVFFRDRIYKRKYELNNFSLPPEIKIIQNHPILYYLRNKCIKFTSKYNLPPNQIFLTEPKPPKFRSSFYKLKIKTHATLEGYWTSERYFSDIKSTLRKDLQFLTPIHPELKDVSERINNSNSVAIHVRRVMHKYSSNLNANYYQSAINQMKMQLDTPKFFVFSDDPNWCKANLNATNIEIITNKNLPDIEDFKLMSQCKHFIIPHSSFSWWASWLSQNENKKIISPYNKFWDNESITAVKY